MRIKIERVALAAGRMFARGAQAQTARSCGGYSIGRCTRTAKR
jgi:hypothetical protein